MEKKAFFWMTFTQLLLKETDIFVSVIYLCPINHRVTVGGGKNWHYFVWQYCIDTVTPNIHFYEINVNSLGVK